MTRARATTLLLLLGAAACGPAPRVGERRDAGDELTPALSSIQQHVLTPSCATTACHSGNPPPNNVPVSMDPGRSFDEMVDVKAGQAPLLLVNPGHPEASYLLLKIKGTAGEAGGIDTLMPIGAPALAPEQVEAIEDWIANGAPND